MGYASGGLREFVPLKVGRARRCIQLGQQFHHRMSVCVFHDQDFLSLKRSQGLITPILVQKTNGYGAFFFFAAFSAMSFFFVLFFVPETKGVSLEGERRSHVFVKMEQSLWPLCRHGRQVPQSYWHRGRGATPYDPQRDSPWRRWARWGGHARGLL